jgi:hypothetical protein
MLWDADKSVETGPAAFAGIKGKDGRPYSFVLFGVLADSTKANVELPR